MTHHKANTNIHHEERIVFNKLNVIFNKFDTYFFIPLLGLMSTTIEIGPKTYRPP